VQPQARPRRWRPQEGQVLRRRFHSRALFCSPANDISTPTPAIEVISTARCGSRFMCTFDSSSSLPRNVPSARMGVAAEVDVTAAAIGDVRVELRRPEVRVPEHLLDAAEIGAAFE
jgi:hypothetical protein